MAAESRVQPDETAEGVFRFVMAQPIPSYLIALAVGDLAFQSLGPRTGVWAEPSVLESAAYEFADVEAMVAAIEKRFGPYRWGRYDILVLPPSFPFGGMENPRLTFATPTILAGDRSLVSLIAHELAHSWSGNLVTNATWRDFWLNEGFTTYLERRIIEDLYGADRADMESVLGLAELRDELKTQSAEGPGPAHRPDRPRPRRRDDRDSLREGRALPPDAGESVRPRPVRRLPPLVLRPLRLPEHHHGRLRGLSQGTLARAIRPRPRAIDLTAWLEGPGLPAGFAEPKSARLDAIDQAASGWLDGSVADRQAGAEDWSTQEWIRFLQALPEKLPVERLTELDRAFGLTGRGNAEIAHQWLLIAIRNQYAPADERLKSYLTTIGRRKLVLPLYKALLATPAGRQRAEAIYATARPGYHPITVESVDRLLKQVQKRIRSAWCAIVEAEPQTGFTRWDQSRLASVSPRQVNRIPFITATNRSSLSKARLARDLTPVSESGVSSLEDS